MAEQDDLFHKYKKLAEDAEADARRAKSATLRDAFLTIANQYDRLAKSVEKNDGQPGSN